MAFWLIWRVKPSFDDAERGFSFRFDAPLDMRMNRNAGFTAADVVNTYEEVDLARVIIQYGELQTGRRMARALVKRRAASPLRTVSDLTETVAPLISPARMKRDMARVFQALRIEVNHELDAWLKCSKRRAAYCAPVAGFPY